MSDRDDSGKPSPGKAFLLSLAAPKQGHRYAGRRKRGQIAWMVMLALIGLTVAFSMLPPANSAVLVVMILPPVALVVWWVGSAIAAAVAAGSAEAEGRPLGPDFAILSAAEALVNVVSVSGAVALLYSLSSIGAITTPNDDMAPTTLEGDLVVTWKDYYHDRLPERGDVAVVKLPGVEGDRIMRIVGLPGDSLLGVLGVLTINGQAVGRSADGDFAWRDAGGTHRNAPRYIESLPGGASYAILQSAEGMFRGTLLGANLRIPDGHYFVIGDNRDSSKSSWDFGMLPGLVLGDRPTVILSSSRSNLIGRSIQP